MAGLNGGKMLEKGDNKDKIIAQKPQQLSSGIIPARIQCAIEKIACRAQKRPTEDNRAFRAQRPGENSGIVQDQRDTSGYKQDREGSQIPTPKDVGL